MRQQRGNLGQKRVGQDGCRFFFADAAGVADQLAHAHLEGRGQPLQRTQRGNRLAVFNFGDVGAGHLHTPCQLALAQMARSADVAHLAGHMQTGLGGSRNRLAGHQLRGQRCGLLDVEGVAAFSAKGVAGPVLDHPAVFTTHYFARFQAHQGSCHGLCAERQSLVSGVPFRTTIFVRLGEMNHNCQVET